MPVEPPLWLTPALGTAVFLALLLAERLRPLRQSVESKPRRVARNLAVGGLSFALIGLLQTPLVLPVSEWVARRGVGLAQLVPGPAALRVVLAVVVLDYTLWIWHYANHKLPFLWRFHVAHHVDRDLDASTALRFHFGETALSVPYRALQVLIAGAEPVALWTWQALLFVSILFHHSNVRLPLGLERFLVRLIVTPRMHGIHHSDRKLETDTNWSSLLSAWDHLHGTVLLNVPQDDVAIGVPAYRDVRDVTLGKVLAIPFRRQREDWRGSPSARPLDAGRPTILSG